jgi:hypothetical protein
MMRRRRGPSLLATAVVVGGAAHVGAKSAQKGAQEQANAQAAAQQNAEQSAQIAELQAQQAAAAAPPAAPAVDPKTAELQNLANLHAQGVLTDEEYAAAKAKALGI